jgi:hypothetical protein
MRTQYRLVAVGFFLFVAISASSGADPSKLASRPNKNDFMLEEYRILDAVQSGFSKDGSPNASDRARKRKFVRVTNRPDHIPRRNAVACGPATQKMEPDGPHNDHWIDVYVTQAGYSVLKQGKGIYPQGTMILKQKYTDPDRKKTDLFTGMLKRQKGYNPEVGDWEFFILNSTGKTVTALGRIESCIQCHAEFKDHDFVSRDYLPESENRVEDSQQAATLRVGP